MTSHDVVAFVRRLTGVRRVGHSGTLDPAAAGVLNVLIGPAVRLVEYLQEGRKVYRCRLVLGATTDTQDATGQVIERRPVVTGRSDLEAILGDFVGPIEQVPPMYSSLKAGGLPLHKLARRGLEVERRPRPVVIWDLRVLDYRASVSAGEGDLAEATLEVVCSKGTYVRTLCTDVGRRLGCGGHMGFLIRLESGGFTLENGATLEELAAARETERLADCLRPAADLLRDWPELRVGAEEAAAITSGRWRTVTGCLIKADSSETAGRPWVKVTQGGDLVAVGRREPTVAAVGPTLVHLEKAFPRGNEARGNQG
jgi:tRNA pseudouridine55 synthase